MCVENIAYLVLGKIGNVSRRPHDSVSIDEYRFAEERENYEGQNQRIYASCAIFRSLYEVATQSSREI